MKIRGGFVSNSSSSSFIIIGDGGLSYKDSAQGGLWNSLDLGENEFGWSPCDYTDVHSRVNFAFLQAESASNAEWNDMIVEVIKQHTGASEVYNVETTGRYDGYIDHQSAACEGENTDMFESPELLRKFLFADGSYIHTDNDNH